MNSQADLQADSRADLQADLQAFFENSSDLIIEHDALLVCRAANPAAIALLQIQPGAWIGKRSQVAIAAAVASARPYLRQLVRDLQHLLTWGESLHPLYEILVDGERRSFEVRHTVIRGKAGAIDRIFSQGREVTTSTLTACPTLPRPSTERSPLSDSRLQLAELLQLVLDNIPQALFWKNRDLVYLGCNRNWAKAAGFATLSDVVGKTDYDLIWKEEAELYRSQDRQVIETNTPVLHLIEHRLNADGQESWIDVNKIPIRDSQANVIGLLGTIEDITERKLAEIALQKSETQLRQQTEQLEQTLQELRQTQAQLVQTEKMSSLGQLVAGVAHEINNPVSFIYGNVNHAQEYIQDLLNLVQLYQQNYPNPVPPVQAELEAIDLEFLLRDLPKLLASMRVGAERIQTIVLALRNFSRMDEAEVKVVDLHEGIDSTLMILHSRLKAKPDAVEIQVVKAYGDLPNVECYAGQLNQVFMNILANAIDALEESIGQRQRAQEPISEQTITIRTERLEGDRVCVRIADNGAGMTEAVRTRLFDPFFTTKPVGKGTGLGLSISYQIVVERHQGTVQCCSEPGCGTEFRIEIPVTQPLR